jgi:hypothetical protein
VANTGVEAEDAIAEDQRLGPHDRVAEGDRLVVLVEIVPRTFAEALAEARVAGGRAGAHVFRHFGERNAGVEAPVDHAHVVALEVVRQARHPRDVVRVALPELELGDLLAVREDAAHVLAFVIATEHDARRTRAKEVDDGARIGPSIHEIPDAHDEVVVADRGPIEQLEELVVAAVDVPDDQRVHEHVSFDGCSYQSLNGHARTQSRTVPTNRPRESPFDRHQRP